MIMKLTSLTVNQLIILIYRFNNISYASENKTIKYHSLKRAKGFWMMIFLNSMINNYRIYDCI